MRLPVPDGWLPIIRVPEVEEEQTPDGSTDDEPDHADHQPTAVLTRVLEPGNLSRRTGFVCHHRSGANRIPAQQMNEVKTGLKIQGTTEAEAGFPF